MERQTRHFRQGRLLHYHFKDLVYKTKISMGAMNTPLTARVFRGNMEMEKTDFDDATGTMI